MDIKIAQSENELASIYAFRYNVYIDEFDKSFLYHNTENKTLKDNLDKIAYQAFSKSNDGDVVSCMRCILQNYTDRLGEEYKWNNSELRKYNFALLDRFMIKKELRGSRIAFKYMDWIYRFGLCNSVEIALIKIEPALLKFYNRYGFIAYDKSYVDNNDSVERILCYLNLLDRVNLAICRSPYLKLLDSHLETNNYTGFENKKVNDAFFKI